MKGVTVNALGVAIGIGVAACSDKNPSAPAETDLNPPAGMLISNPQVSSSAGNSIGGVISLGVSASSVAYISAAPGTFPGGVSVAVRNETRSGPSLSVQLIDGGFDPVGVEARVGDELSLKVLVPWRTATTRVTVEQGLSYVEFEFSRR